jgi:uncharacterized cofD-like protein
MSKYPKVVGIGGGTGLSTILEGLKKYTDNITAIVTVTDDGGSSGRLRKDFNMLPPGDIRNCIVSLGQSDSLLSELFQYRFKANNELEGHPFGNLFIAAMTEITGSFAKGILEASHILAIKGKVLPSTLTNVELGAEFIDDTMVTGQTKIVNYNSPIRKVFLIPKNPTAYKGVIKACKEADIIILGPGSLFTSIIPNLLVKGIAKAVRKAEAVKIYVGNIMTQPGETDDYTATDHLIQVEKYLKGTIDYFIINTGKISKVLIEKHTKKRSFEIVDDSHKISERVKIIKENLVSNKDYARHDPEKTAKILLSLI